MNKLSATIKKINQCYYLYFFSQQNMELLLTSISWVLITSVVSNLSYFDYLTYLEFLTTSSQLQKQDNHFSTQLQNYFLTSFFLAVVTFVVPNLSHSECLNLPVTVENLQKKKKARVVFAYLANKYGITYLPQLPWVVVASLALILWHSDYQWLLTTNNRHSVSPLKRGSFKIKSRKGSSMP